MIRHISTNCVWKSFLENKLCIVIWTSSLVYMNSVIHTEKMTEYFLSLFIVILICVHFNIEWISQSVSQSFIRFSFHFLNSYNFKKNVRESCCIASQFPLLPNLFEQEIKHFERSVFRLPSSVFAKIMCMRMCCIMWNVKWRRNFVK